MARRRRELSPEDRWLWDEVARSATPLTPAPPAMPVAPGPPVAPPPEPASALRPRSPAPPRAAPDFAADPLAALERATPHMDRRRFDRLRKGRMSPEARIDLHGMTSERAHAALTGFVLGAHADGLRLVLVITGKGRPDDDGFASRRHGILRHSVPHWLANPALAGRILQVTPAHQRHGGSGALYVYLRRHR